MGRSDWSIESVSHGHVDGKDGLTLWFFRPTSGWTTFRPFDGYSLIRLSGHFFGRSLESTLEDFTNDVVGFRPIFSGHLLFVSLNH